MGNLVDDIMKAVCIELSIGFEEGYTSVYFHELSEKKYSDIEQMPFREITIRMYKKTSISKEK